MLHGYGCDPGLVVVSGSTDQDELDDWYTKHMGIMHLMKQPEPKYKPNVCNQALEARVDMQLFKTI